MSSSAISHTETNTSDDALPSRTAPSYATGYDTKRRLWLTTLTTFPRCSQPCREHHSEEDGCRKTLYSLWSAFASDDDPTVILEQAKVAVGSEAEGYRSVTKPLCDPIELAVAVSRHYRAVADHTESLTQGSTTSTASSEVEAEHIRRRASN